MFEDDVINLNVANLYLDFIIWKQYSNSVLFLPFSILKKFAKSPHSALLKVNDLMNERNVLEYEYIMILHEDKFNKKDKSLIFVQGLSNVKEQNESMIIVFKEGTSFSDSEMDSIIDLRKLLSQLTQENISKEILPSKVQAIQKMVECSEPQDTSKIFLCLVQTILNDSSLLLPSQSSDIPATPIMINDSSEFDSQITQEIRDLLYFLYDYKFFECYDIMNESSFIQSRRPTTSQLAAGNVDQSLSESFLEQEMSNNISEGFIEEINEDFLPSSPPVPEQQEDQLKVDTSLQNINSNKSKFLPTIFEDDNEQSFNISVDCNHHGNKSEQQQQRYQDISNSLSMYQDQEADDNYDDALEDYNSNKQALELLNEEIQLVIKKKGNLDLPKQPKEVAAVKIDLKPSKKSIINDSRDQAVTQKMNGCYEFNNHSQPYCRKTIVLEPIWKLEQDELKDKNQCQKVLRNCSKQKLVESFFQSKVHSLKRKSIQIKQQVSSPSSIEYEQIINNDEFDYQFKEMMLNIFTPDSMQSSKEEQQIQKEHRILKVEDLEYSSEQQKQVSVLDSEQMYNFQSSSILECSPSIYEKENYISNNNINVFRQTELAQQQPCGDFLDYLDSDFHLISQDNSKNGANNIQVDSRASNTPQPYLLVNDENSNIFELPMPFEEVTNQKQSKLKIKCINTDEKHPIKDSISHNYLTLNQQLDSDRRTRILKSVKNGKFSFKTKKPLQSGRVKYKSVSSNANVDFQSQNKLGKNLREQPSLISSQNDESNSECHQCSGSNWNQKYNMPCTNCINTPMINNRKQYKDKKKQKCTDYPRQIQILDASDAYD